MNIVKIKDIILKDASEFDVSVFNDDFRGRYAYLINGYILPIGLLDYSPDELMRIDTVWFENDNISIDDQSIIDNIIANSIKLQFLQYVVDNTETTKTNNYIDSKYRTLNNYIPSDITSDMVKKFRTWLAKTLLTFDTITDVNVKHVLNYYASGMYDSTVQSLTVFGNVQVKDILNITGSTCSCHSNNNIIAESVNCDVLGIYRKNIYNKMVETFSNVDFWVDLDPEFLAMFKLYIDNIIVMDLPLSSSTYASDFADCSCMINENTLQLTNKDRLSKLSKAIEYMINDDLTGHRLYINGALTDWAAYLYELMEWN